MPYRQRHVTTRIPAPSPASPSQFRYVKEQKGWYGDGKEVLAYRSWETTNRTPPRRMPNGNISYMTATYRGCPEMGTQQSLLNRAYTRFRDKTLGGTASLLVVAGEWKSSFTMIANRATQLRRAYSRARKFDIPGMCKALKASVLPKHRGMSRSAASKYYGAKASGLWLEYSFGWSPLVGDIHSAVQVLGKPHFPTSRYYGSAKGPYHEVWQENTNRYTRYNGSIKYRVYGSARVSNPNALLLNQLGLHNPLQVAWELIPFSFLIDWAFDINTFISSFTDFVGVAVEQTGYTYFFKGEVYHQDGSDAEISQGWGTIGDTFQVLCQRVPGLPKPVPNADVIINVGSSWRRTANAVSLLTQVLSSR